jgi:FKBP-type peptidyl-prolyl cis-trans isomerase 2
MAARGALTLAAAAALAACGGRQPRVAEGATVKLAYTVEADGAPYHKTPGPITVRIGTGALLPSIEARLMGRKAGEVVSMTLSPFEAYGERDPGKVARIPLERFGAQAKGLRVGDKVGGAAGAQAAEGVVTALDAASATLDFNPPLAGKTLAVRVSLIEVLP